MNRSLRFDIVVVGGINSDYLARGTKAAYPVHFAGAHGKVLKIDSSG